MAEHVTRTVKINVCIVLIGEAKGMNLIVNHGYE